MVERARTPLKVQQQGFEESVSLKQQLVGVLGRSPWEGVRWPPFISVKTHVSQLNQPKLLHISVPGCSWLAACLDECFGRKQRSFPPEGFSYAALCVWVSVDWQPEHYTRLLVHRGISVLLGEGGPQALPYSCLFAEGQEWIDVQTEICFHCDFL